MNEPARCVESMGPAQTTLGIEVEQGGSDYAKAGSAEPVDLVGLLAVAGAGLLPVVRVSQMYFGGWAPKAALCLVLLFPGLVVLARLAVAGSRAARLAIVFLAVACLSTALSDKPTLSLVGPANWGTGLIFAGTLAGAWALGAACGERRREQMLLALIAATVANAAVAWAQARGLAPPALTDLRPTTAGRASGLMGNPVYLGALTAGGLWLLGRRFGAGRRSWWWLPAVALVAGAVQLSGGRAAVALAALATLAALPGAGRARATAFVAAAVVGVVLAPAGASDVVLGSSRAAVVSRSDTRFAVWRVSTGALAERPLVGWGPGRFAAATGPRYDHVAAQDGVVLQDAHNWVVEYAVTTGLLGLALLLAWLGAAGRGARGPLAGVALIFGASTLVQPLHVALTPLAMFALGAAGSAQGHGRGLGRYWGGACIVGLVVGLALGGVLVAGQVYLQRGVQENSLRLVQRAAALSPPWPEVVVAAAAASVDDPSSLGEGEPPQRRTLELSRLAARRDPAEPSLWSELGAVELAWGSEERAAAAFRQALERNPWDVGALVGMERLARRWGDPTTIHDSCRRLRALTRAPASCPPLER